MRALILSDLHDDFWAEDKRSPFDGIEAALSQLDLVLLAGDVSNKPKVRWKYAFHRLSEIVPLERIAVFPGNHDFYDFCIDREDRLRDIADSFGVTYAQKTALKLGNARILCATLWTDFELGAGGSVNKPVVANRMNDYRKIRVAARAHRRLRPSDAVTVHKDHLAWLETELAKPFNGTTYVATHHAPHPSVLQTYATGLDAAYASDLGDLIRRHAPTAWFFGHCHDAATVTFAQTELRNVALGYPDEVADPAARIRDLIFEL